MHRGERDTTSGLMLVYDNYLRAFHLAARDLCTSEVDHLS